MIIAAFVILAVLFFALIVVRIIGGSLPREHSAEQSTVIGISPEQIYTLVKEVPNYPAWRPSVKKVEVLKADAEHPVFKIWNERRGMPLALISDVPYSILVFEVAENENAMFGGTWTYAFKEEGDGCRMTLRESGWINPPIFRFLARYIIGHGKSIDMMISDLRLQTTKMKVAS